MFFVVVVSMTTHSATLLKWSCNPLLRHNPLVEKHCLMTSSQRFCWVRQLAFHKYCISHHDCLNMMLCQVKNKLKILHYVTLLCLRHYCT